MTIEATRYKIEEQIDNLNKTIYMLKIKSKEENKSILDEIIGELDEKKKLVKKADEAQLGLIEAELKKENKFILDVIIGNLDEKRMIPS